jgi:predicted amidophosphoribosyltransferase
VCRVCCGPSVGGQALCFACRWVGHRLGLPLAPVFVLRLCPLPGPLYTVLMGYKESPVLEARARFRPMVRELVDGFLASHAACLAAAAGGPFDVVLPVPSSARPGGSPLNGVERLATTVSNQTGGARWSPDLLTRTGVPVGHMRPDSDAFALIPAIRSDVAGGRVLLLDDTYVSGARAQSAAGALRRGGARSVMIVVVGRVLRPDRSPVHARFLRYARRATEASVRPGWAGDPCRRCAQTGASTE